MKEKVKALWKLCFDDSDQFIDMYFRLRYIFLTIYSRKTHLLIH